MVTRKGSYMNKAKIISEGKNYTAVDLGKFDDLGSYTYLHPKLNREVGGKIFLGEILKSTGAEISFQILPPHGDISFLHQHRNHEEIYLIVKGKGQYQVDSKCFDIAEGSIVRVAPDGKRTLRNNSDVPLVFMVIQIQLNSLDCHGIEDGFRVDGEIFWEI